MSFSFTSRFLLMLLLALASAAAQASDGPPPKVLMVVSGEGRDEGKTRPGFEMDEFAQAWLIFRDNGLAVEVASPVGGRVEADRFNAKEPFNARVLTDPQAVAQLAATRPSSALRAQDYAAVFVVGGKGAMFDLPQDRPLQSLLAQVYQRGGVVGAVCHGPAALVDVTLADGSSLVAGRRLTGFSNEEEALFGKTWAKHYRFQLEDALRERGARWEEAPLMMPHTVVDGRLVTGQNPYSTPAVAEAMVRALGRTPLTRTPWRDEQTLALVQRLIDGDVEGARETLAAEPARYHAEMIGMLGYYQLQAASDDTAVSRALAIMQLARPHMAAPQLAVGIAQAQWQLGRQAEAREELAQVLAKHPALEEAQALKARMDH